MTPLNLVKELAKTLREACGKIKLPAQYQPEKKVTVYEQGVPTEEFEKDSFYPLICVELLSVEDDVEISVASVLITVGTYNNESAAGLQDHLNLLETVRQCLLKNQIISQKFSAILPMYTGLVEKSSEEFSYSNIFVQYQIASVNKSFVDEFLFGEQGYR